MPLATSRSRSPIRQELPLEVSETQRAAAARTFVLDIPFAMRTAAQQAGAVWNTNAKAFLYRGGTLPAPLETFRSELYSWERLKEDELNGLDAIVRPAQKPLQLRDHQKQAVSAIRAAVSAGRTGFLNADDVGLGKTIETWAGVLDMQEVETVLVVCPLAVVAHWRRTIQWMGDAGKRIVVINYDRLKKLFDIPAEIASRSASRRRGRKVRKVRTAKGIARYGVA